MNVTKIPWQSLSEDALEGVISEFVTREGTEYGAEDIPLDTKISQVRQQLQRGEAVLYFDADSATCQLLLAADARRLIDE